MVYTFTFYTPFDYDSVTCMKLCSSCRPFVCLKYCVGTLVSSVASWENRTHNSACDLTRKKIVDRNIFRFDTKSFSYFYMSLERVPFEQCSSGNITEHFSTCWVNCQHIIEVNRSRKMNFVQQRKSCWQWVQSVTIGNHFIGKSFNLLTRSLVIFSLLFILVQSFSFFISCGCFPFFGFLIWLWQWTLLLHGIVLFH